MLSRLDGWKARMREIREQYPDQEWSVGVPFTISVTPSVDDMDAEETHAVIGYVELSMSVGGNEADIDEHLDLFQAWSNEDLDRLPSSKYGELLAPAEVAEWGFIVEVPEATAHEWAGRIYDASFTPAVRERIHELIQQWRDEGFLSEEEDEKARAN